MNYKLYFHRKGLEGTQTSSRESNLQFERISVQSEFNNKSRASKNMLYLDLRIRENVANVKK
jgi:hypothetical protein